MMETKLDGVERRSGRYPWGTKPNQMAEVEIPCELCGKLHIEYAIDGHVSKPHFCEDCFRKIVKEYEEETK